MKLALNHGVAGQLDGPSSYLMRVARTTSDPIRWRAEDTEKFIAKYARARSAHREAEEVQEGQEDQGEGRVAKLR